MPDTRKCSDNKLPRYATLVINDLTFKARWWWSHPL